MTWTVGQRTFRLGRRPGTLWPVVIAVLAALLVAGTVVALARAGHGGSADRASTSGANTARTAPGAAADAGSGAALASGGGESSAASGAGTAASGAAAPPAIPAPSIGAKIVRTANLRVRVKGSFDAAIERATTVATALGGFVESSSTSSLERGSSSAELALRVPADRFDEARGELTKLGKLQSLEMSGRDVGGQLVDLDARLRAARAEEDALTALLAKAGDIGQILQVRDRIAAVRTEIEQLDGEQAALRDQVSMSTIHVSFDEGGASAVEHTSKREKRDATSIGDSIGTALDAGEAVVGGTLIVFGALLPLLVLGLLGWLGWAIPFRRRRPPEAVTEHTFG